MMKILKVISYLSLVLLIAAPILFFAGKIDLDKNKLLMLIATVIWFATAVFWMGREKKADS